MKTWALDFKTTGLVLLLVAATFLVVNNFVRKAQPAAEAAIEGVVEGAKIVSSAAAGAMTAHYAYENAEELQGVIDEALAESDELASFLATEGAISFGCSNWPNPMRHLPIDVVVAIAFGTQSYNWLDDISGMSELFNERIGCIEDPEKRKIVAQFVEARLRKFKDGEWYASIFRTTMQNLNPGFVWY